MKEVVILGAGLTGLTTAMNLQKRGVDLLILEKGGRAGGVIHTVTEKGFTYEEGPNSGVIANVEVLRLFKELKLEEELDLANELVKKRYILKKGRWEALPSGPWSAIKTPLFTLKDKFRILGEPFRKRGTNPNETLAELVKRRLGQSFLDYAIDPFILGVYAGDPSRLVPRFALPKLYQLEQQYGSFIRGSIKKQSLPKTAEEKQVTRGVFSTRGGLSTLIKALTDRVGLERIQLNAAHIVVSRSGDHFTVSYTEPGGNRVEIATKQVISTVGAYELDQLFPFIDESIRSKITTLHYAQVLEIVLGFNHWQGMPLDAFGGLIPFKEKRAILGALFMSALFKERAPEGGALFSIFMGGVRNPELCQLNESEIRALVQQEICSVMGLKQFKPDLFRIIAHWKAIPQYEADSGERLEAVQMAEQQFPGLILGGNLRDGIGMADRIAQGALLAEQACR